jgi:hypothetical protein
MKHIKLFEDLNEYYVKGDISDLYHDDTNQFIDIDFKYFSYFSNILKVVKLPTYITNICEGLRLFYNGGTCNIFEMKDEWFYVIIYPDNPDNRTLGKEGTLYKCDQFDGLKKLLKDKGII